MKWTSSSSGIISPGNCVYTRVTDEDEIIIRHKQRARLNVLVGIIETEHELIVNTLHWQDIGDSVDQSRRAVSVTATGWVLGSSSRGENVGGRMRRPSQPILQVTLARGRRG